MITWPYKIGATALALIAIFAFGYVKGKSDGRVSALKDTVEAYEKRKGIDDAVSSVNRYDMCVYLGGLPVECAQLRRVDEASEGE